MSDFIISDDEINLYLENNKKTKIEFEKFNKENIIKLDSLLVKKRSLDKELEQLTFYINSPRTIKKMQAEDKMIKMKLINLINKIELIEKEIKELATFINSYEELMKNDQKIIFM